MCHLGQSPSCLAVLGFRTLLPATSQGSRLPCLLSVKAWSPPNKSLMELLRGAESRGASCLLLDSLEGETQADGWSSIEISPQQSLLLLKGEGILTITVTDNKMALR